VQSVVAGIVSTPAAGNIKPGWLVISSERLAEDSLRLLGSHPVIAPNWRHALMTQLTNLLPRPVLRMMMNAASKRLVKKTVAGLERDREELLQKSKDD